MNSILFVLLKNGDELYKYFRRIFLFPLQNINFYLTDFLILFKTYDAQKQ